MSRAEPYYEERGVTIYHGDCREILPELESVDLVLTDPPYAMSGARSEWKVTASVGTGIHYAAKKVKKGGAMLCFTTSSGRGIEFTLGAVGQALPFNRLLVWHKPAGPSRVAGPWRWDIIAILAFGRATFGRAAESSVVTSGWASETDHPTEIPVGIARRLYEPFGGSVLDPFMGSGSLILPAARAGQRAIGIDVDERHCELAVQRLQQEVLEVAA